MIRLAFVWLFVVALLAGGRAYAAPPVEAYGKLPGVTDVTLSPSGDHVAMVATDGKKRSIYILTTADNKPLCTGAIGSLKVRDLTWAGEDYVLVRATATVNLGMEFGSQRDELATVLVVKVSSGEVTQVFGRRHAQKVANSVFGFYGTQQIDGRWYGWFGGITYAQGTADIYLNHAFPDLYRVDLENGDVQKVASGSEDIDEWLVSTSGEVVARSLYDERHGTWQILAGRDGSQMITGGKADFGGAGRLHLGTSPDRLVVDTPTGMSGDNHDSSAFRDFSLTGGAERPIANEADVENVLFDPVSRLWIGETLFNDEREPTFFAPALEARWRGARKAFPKNIVHLKSWSSDFNKLVVFTEGGDDPGTYWFVDIATRHAAPIGYPYPLVKSEDVGAVRMVDWRAADGMALRGVLTVPPGSPGKSLPLVVLPHGGPESRDYPGFDWWAQAFASRGYAVFQPNFRGSSGYGVAFRNAGFGQWGRKMQTDISDGVAELARQGIVDPKRACIVGGSYGGYAALAGVTVQQGLYRCAVAVAGVADLSSFLIYDSKRAGYRSSTMRYWKAFMGVTSSSDDALNAISPVEQAARADAPILLIHGKDDTVVPIDQSEKMEAALKRAGKPVELVTMDGEDHWLSREETRIQMLTAAVAFVQKHNPAN